MTLKEAWTKVDPVAASSEDETADHPSEGVDMEVVAEIGWVAAQNLALDVARQCTCAPPAHPLHLSVRDAL